MSQSKSRRGNAQRNTKATKKAAASSAARITPTPLATTASAVTQAAPKPKARRSVPKRRRSVPLWIYGGLLLILLIALLPVYRTLTQPQVGQSVGIMPSSHVSDGTTMSYNSNPPTSGSHSGAAVAWSTSATALPDSSLVHNLEHGGIIFHYQPTLDAAQRQQLTDLARDLRQIDRKVVLAPREANDAAITATAWGRVLKLDTFDGAQLRAFFEANRNRAPEREPS